MLELPNNFLDALRTVETGHAHNHGEAVVGDGGAALGPFQIHRAYWRDAVQYEPELGRYGTYADCAQEGYSRAVVTAYLNRYGYLAVKHGDLEKLARLHNGGPKGCENRTTLAYWRKVQLLLCVHNQPLTLSEK